MRILLAAEEAAGVRTLQAAIESGHELVAVLTSSPQNGVSREAARHGTPVLPAARLKDKDFAAEIRRQEADVLLNVHSLYVIPGEILEELRFGSFNLHPGPLPDYAGMNAPSWAIYNREPRHGVTLHWMNSGVDKGLIAYQRSFELLATDTGLSVALRCASLGLEMIHQLLADLKSPSPNVPRIPQDLTRRRYFGRKIPHEGRVPAGMTAVELDHFVRASDYSPFPSPWGSPTIHFEGAELGLVRISLTGQPAPSGSEGLVSRQGNGHWWLATADEWVQLERIKWSGKISDASSLPLREGNT